MWRALTASDVTAKFTPAESAMLTSVQGNIDLIPAGAAYDSNGSYVLSGLVTGNSYSITFDTAELSLINGTQTLTASGSFVAQGTSVTLTGTPSAAVTAVLWSATSGLGKALNVVVNEFIGALSAANYPVNTDGTVPDQLRRHIVALTVWTWLRDFPRLTAFKTDERKQAAADAEKIYEKICNRTFGAIESPTGTDFTTANWNSNPKIISRMSPTPPTATQLQNVPTPLYSNPNAPTDTVPPNSPGVPLMPTGFMVMAGNAQVFVVWNPVVGAKTYTLYRGTSTGQETSYKTGLTTTNYLDASLTNGANYFYRLEAVNTVGTSPQTPEIVATPQSTIVN